MREKKGGILGGVAMLATAGLLVKVTGVLYKIPLTYLLGDEGMGYFNAAYTIYSWLYMLSTAGFPIALSILISEAESKGAYEKVRSLQSLAFFLLSAIGILGSLAMAIFAPQLASIVGTRDAVESIRAIAPALFFICITSLFRGIFQGYRNMAPSALSQLIESLGKVGFGLAFAYYGASRGAPLYSISALAILGVSVGTAAGTLYLLIRYLVARHRDELSIRQAKPEAFFSKNNRDLFGRMIGISIPVTIGASVMALTTLVDLAMMIRRLQTIGYSTAEATALYGNYTALVVPMFNLPTILITPIASGIIPALSSAQARGDAEKKADILKNTFRIVAAISIPCALGMCFLSRPILGLLYPPSSVESAYTLLSTVSPAVYFLAILTVTNAVLQATGHQRLSMWGMFLGAISKVAIGYILLGLPNVGILGAPLGTVTCYLVALVFSLVSLAKTSRYVIPFGDLVARPLLAALGGVGAAALVYRELFYMWGRVYGILSTIVLAILLYGVCSLSLGVFSPSDLKPMLCALRKKDKAKQKI